MHPNNHRSIRRTAIRIICVGVAGAALVACGGSDDGDDANGDQPSLVVYSGREKELVEPIYEAFEQESGIELDVRYGDSAALAAQIGEEGDRSPADVFYAQDAGAIGSIEDRLAELPDEQLHAVDDQFRDPDARWIGITGRVRTLVYNTDRVEESELPESVLDVTGSAWRGRVGVAPTNASFIAFVTAMRQELGDDETRAFLEGLVENEARTYEKNGAIVEAVSRGEVDAGLVNHYYLYEARSQDDAQPIENHFFDAGDIGNLVNTSAIGVLSGTEHQEAAAELVDYLLNEGQTFIAEEAEEREYPLANLDELEGSERYAELPALDELGAPDVDLSGLGDELEATVRMIQESGLTS